MTTSKPSPVVPRATSGPQEYALTPPDPRTGTLMKRKVSRIDKGSKKNFMTYTYGHLQDLYKRIEEEVENLICVDDTNEEDSGVDSGYGTETSFTFAGSDKSDTGRKDQSQWHGGFWTDGRRRTGGEEVEQAPPSPSPAPAPGLTGPFRNSGSESPQPSSGGEEAIGEYQFTDAHSYAHVTPPKCFTCRECGTKREDLRDTMSGICGLCGATFKD